MPVMKRHKTNYTGVVFIEGKAVASGKPEKIFYITYRRDGKLHEEKAGRQFQDNMSAAKAARMRAERIDGKALSNNARREKQREENEAQKLKYTVSRIWDEYLLANATLRGLETDKNRFENYLKPVFGDKELQEISPLDVDRQRISLLKTKSPQTVKHVLALLGRLSNYAVSNRLCPGISFKINLPKVNNIKTEDLNPDQLRNLLKAIEADTHPQAGKMLKLALYTGMRRGEIFRLQWGNVDFHNDFINIKDPKGGYDAKIPLNLQAKDLLQGIYKSNSPFVFPGRNGEQHVDIKKAVNVIRDNAKLPKDFRPFHGLRHTFASGLASSGQVDLYTLQKLLTHKSPQMTQRYAHLRDESLRRASALAGEIINKGR